MSSHYAPLPNPRTDGDAQDEMEAAFDDSEDEDDQLSESRPLTSNTKPASPSLPEVQSQVPGAYDFENVDYDYPPPGSPPRPSASALPNEHGNTNGLIPSFDLDTSATARKPRGWFSRTAAAILPSHYVQRLGLTPRIPTGAIGGGSANDGVFANVTAKPTRPVRVADGDNVYLVPEEARQEAPPSYASAQADAVPPYWETTVHAPFSPDSPGEMIIENLPTGSLFSFLWNMLVTISFQLVGFLLTYLLHTTHAAKLGSRAGLGVILIQYGFALRGRQADVGGDGSNAEEIWKGWGVGPAQTDPGTTAEDYYNLRNMSSTPTMSNAKVNAMVVDATRQWLSFFLMTVGWFVLLTALLNFWRIKRWERGIMASQRENASAVPASAAAGSSHFEHILGLRNTLILRQGLGFGAIPWERPQSGGERGADAGNMVGHDEENPVIPLDPDDPERSRRAQEAWANEMRLREDLRAAGLI